MSGGGLTVSESVLLAENKVLKGKYEDLLKDHEALIQTLEVLEKTQTEDVAAKEEVKHWEIKYGELRKKYGELKEMLEKLEKAIESSDEFGVDSGVIEISSESSDDEGDQRESSGGRGESNYQNQEKLSFYL